MTRQDVANLSAVANELTYQLARPLLLLIGTRVEQLKPPFAWRWERDEIIAEEFELRRQRWEIGGPSA